MALTESLAAYKLHLLLAGVLVVGGGGAAYAATGGDLPGLDGPMGSEPSLLEYVPEDVDMVQTVDTAVVGDPTTEQLVNGFIDIAEENSRGYDGPANYEEMLSEARNESDLDPAGLHGVVTFAEYPGQNAAPDADPYLGALVDSDWNTTQLVDTLEEDGTTYEEREFRGYTVYVEETSVEYASQTWVGVLSDGTYVFGTENVIEDVIDVHRGDEEPFGDDLRTALEDTRDGYFRYAVSVPQDRMPEESPTGLDVPVDFTPFRDVDLVSGAYYAEGDAVGSTVTMRAEDADDAEDIADVTDGLVSFVRGSTTIDSVSDALDNVTVERDGAEVTVTYESDVESILEMFEDAVEDQPFEPTY